MLLLERSTVLLIAPSSLLPSPRRPLLAVNWFYQCSVEPTCCWCCPLCFSLYLSPHSTPVNSYLPIKRGRRGINASCEQTHSLTNSLYHHSIPLAFQLIVDKCCCCCNYHFSCNKMTFTKVYTNCFPPPPPRACLSGKWTPDLFSLHRAVLWREADTQSVESGVRAAVT